MKFTYKTKDKPGNESQYGPIPFDDENNTVEAIYIKQKNPEYEGNILAEALPPQPTDEIIRGYNTRGLPWFDYRLQIQASKQAQFTNIHRLNDVRFPMPYQADLAASIHNAFLQAAASRFILFDHTQCVIQHINGQNEVGHCKSYGNNGGTTGNFILSGTAGTGKSTSLINALHYYPQKIIHHCEEIPMFTQITYVVAECPPNSNLSGLYISIARSYDLALKNLDGHYEQECMKKRRLDQMESFICDLINRFHTLLVVIDEVQNIDFSRTKSGSIYTLMKLKNETKVSIAFCGLYSACENLLIDYAMKRRVKTEIDANPYTSDKRYFSVVVQKLFDYQWFNPKVELKNLDNEKRSKLIDAMYTYSGGIIDQLISLYKMMNYEFVRRKKKPEVNDEFVKDVNDKYFPGILITLSSIHYSLEKQNDRKIAVKTAAETIDDSIRKLNEIEEKKRVDEIIENNLSTDYDKICREVIRTIQGLYPEFTVEQISTIFYRLVTKAEYREKTAQELSRTILDNLQKRFNNRSKKPKFEPGLDSYLRNDYQPLGQGVS